MGLFGISSITWSDAPTLAAIVAATFTAIQTIVILVALIYAYRQTKQVTSQMQLSQIIALRQQLQTVNEFLLKPDVREQAEAIGEFKDDVFAAIMLNTFGALFDLYAAKQQSEDEWKTNVLAIKASMSHPLLWKYWCGDPDKPADQRVARRIYYAPKFRALIDSVLPDEVPPSVRPERKR